MNSKYRRPYLSREALSIWAKSVYRGNPDDTRYLQLWQHMMDTEQVSCLLWENFLPDSVKRTLICDLGSEECALGVLRFVAMAHDIGKASPAFEVQSDFLGDRLRENNLYLDRSLANDPRRSWYRHELVGFNIILNWFERNGFHIFPGSLAFGIASIIGGHHGGCITSEKEQLLEQEDAYRYIGDSKWQCVQLELADWAVSATQFFETLRKLNHRPLRRRSQILLIATVIIADWIASDSRLFPLNESELDEECYDSKNRAAMAWDLLKLPSPWHISCNHMSADELFASRFAIPNARLRPMQRSAVDLASKVTQPCLMIIEANMGEGKTEAALTAAEILAAKFGCGGIYYALPTQATVNAMFHRALEWIGHLPASEQCEMGSVFLAQSKREQNEEYVRLRDAWFEEQDNPIFKYDSVGEVEADFSTASEEKDELQAVVNSWLTGRKRGNLSDFVVGTIDQVLMSALRAKHVALRHLALAGKVVILDEIHSNTAYMNVYMECALSWLGAYGVPVIMLSATLPQARREAFLEAYGSGADSVRGIEGSAIFEEIQNKDTNLIPVKTQNNMLPRRNRRGNINDCVSPSWMENSPAAHAVDMRYPLISYVEGNQKAQYITPESSGRSTDIQISLLPDDDQSLVDLLRAQLADGGCAVVIRNVVSRAQHTYEVLKRAFGSDMDVLLNHSRFMACDRSEIDNQLLEKYGKNSTPKTRNGIVVATQVVEQSLDVDFDIMITDIAPADLILQRAGRLHRHQRGANESNRPVLLQKAQLYVTGISEWRQDGPPRFASGIEKVYQPFFLLRTVSVLNLEPEVITTMHIPADIPRIVQTVYNTDAYCCPKTWREGVHGEEFAHAQLDQKLSSSKSCAQQFCILRPSYSRTPCALGAWIQASVPDPDSDNPRRRQARAAVREGEDSFEILILQQDTAGDLYIPDWVAYAGEKKLTQSFSPPTQEQIRAVLSCSISVNQFSLAFCNLDAVIQSVEQKTPQSWHILMQQSRELNGLLPLILDKEGNTSLCISNTEGSTQTLLQIHYSSEKGWEAHVSR